MHNTQKISHSCVRRNRRLDKLRRCRRLGVFLCPNSSQSWEPFSPPLPPKHFLSPTHSQSAFCFVLLHKHSHRKGAESLLPPFYLLTLYPPSKAVLGQKESPPPPTYSPFFFTPFSHIHTCTYEHTHPYKLNQPGQQLDMRWQIGVFVFWKGRLGGPHAHIYSNTHTHRAIQSYCRQVPQNSRQWAVPPTFKKRNMVLPLWEVESFSSLREWYRDREINREKDRECIR